VWLAEKAQDGSRAPMLNLPVDCPDLSSSGLNPSVCSAGGARKGGVDKAVCYGLLFKPGLIEWKLKLRPDSASPPELSWDESVVLGLPERLGSVVERVVYNVLEQGEVQVIVSTKGAVVMDIETEARACCTFESVDSVGGACLLSSGKVMHTRRIYLFHWILSGFLS
jgi:hypothetical protein